MYSGGFGLDESGLMTLSSCRCNAGLCIVKPDTSYVQRRILLVTRTSVFRPKLYRLHWPETYLR